MTLNDKETEEPMGMGMTMLVGALAGALSAVAVAMIAGRRPRRRSEDTGRTTFAVSGDAETFETAGGGHFPPTNPPAGGGHGNPPPGGGHGTTPPGGGHGGHSGGGGHG